MEQATALPKGWIEVDVSRLVGADWNYKRSDDGTADIETKLENNIKRNGVIENILIRELETGFYEVVNGNHRLAVMKRLKIEKVMAYNFGVITLAQAQRIAIETNETKFPVDDVRLAKVLQDITQEFSVDDLVGTINKSRQEVDDLLKLNNFDWNSLDKGDDPSKLAQNDTETGEERWRTIELRLPESVAEQLEQQIDRFKKLLNPTDKLEDISPVQAVEAMVQNLAQIPDDQAV